MARPGLEGHRKFVRLARALGSEALAMGHLELLWHSAYASGDDYLGDESGVEAAARWNGEPGRLCRLLVDAGGEDKGFIEEIPDRPGRYAVHDLYDHAPEYVRKRMDREAKRRAQGKTLRELRAEAGRKGAAVTHAKAAAAASSEQVPGNCLANGGQVSDKCLANGTLPNPAQDLSSLTRASCARPREASKAGGGADAAPPAPEALRELWNAEAAPELPRCRELTEKRRGAARRALSEHPELGFWSGVIQRINASAFCRGETERGWTATFDWMLRPDTPTRVLEGTYGSGRGPSPPRPAALAVGRSEAPVPEARPWDGYHPRDDVGRHLLEQAAANGDVEALQKLEAWESECADRGVDPWEHCDPRNPVDRQDLEWAVARGSSSAAAAMRRAAGGDA